MDWMYLVYFSLGVLVFFGAKGMGEMVTNTQPPAIINAIHDACGVWVDSLPATAEKILRLLEEKNADIRLMSQIGG